MIIGLGGKAHSYVHAKESGQALSRIQPHYASALTLMVVPGTPVYDWIKENRFEMLSQDEIMNELEIMLEHMNMTTDVVFRTNHASNYLPLRGTLPHDKARMLKLIHDARSNRVPLRPEHLRGL